MTEPTLRIVTDRGLVQDDPSAFQLLVLLQEIRRGSENFLVAHRLSRPEHYFQTVRADAVRGRAQDCYGTRAASGYLIEYRDGSPDRHYQAECATHTEVHDAVTGWAEGRDGWHEPYAWTRLDLGAR
ncbi:hypothetical protein [Myceligenerans indicum]|uniref:Uncharacterized protein n=1 Tax=Myceligenerans indicum TaxID=2593663 RepID=A0ABS1LPE0_9MICO|nr:hypothetical protein [Myceligenerans indicum]MBL0888089.1 hypothetical protein [Myceligenerans indicum]